jgi:hypothetical protein
VEKKKATTCIGVIAVALIIALLIPSGTLATTEQLIAAEVPALVTYQGYLVNPDGDPIDGQVDIQVGIYAASSGGVPLWEETHSNVEVADGYFTIYLGGVTALDSGLFDSTDRWLQVSVDVGDGYDHLPRQRVASVPYALQAQEAASMPWAGLTGVPSTFPPDSHSHAWEEVTDVPTYASRWPTWGEVTGKPATFPPETHDHDARYYTEGELNTSDGGGQVHWDNLIGVPEGFADGMDDSDTSVSYGNVVVVAKSGGDYTSVQTAISSIADASASNPYLVWVGPGIYDERVTMKPYVHVQGAGQEATVITSDYYEGTLVLADHATLEDLTVSNTAAGFYVIAITSQPVINPGAPSLSGARVHNVTAEAQASGQTLAYGLYMVGSGTDIVLENVTAIAENGGIGSHGMIVAGSVQITVRGGTFTGQGGDSSSGIYSSGGTTFMTFGAVEGTTNSVIQDSGTITLTHSTLIGGPASGSVTCVAVSRGSTFNATGCP